MKLQNKNIDEEFFSILNAAAKRKFPDSRAEAEVMLDGDLFPNTYRVEKGMVCGGGKCALLAGVGRMMREPDFCGTFELARPLNGTYFASHFNNYYASAPIDEIYFYLCELAFWGQNALMLWYDMHSYEGVDDPASLVMIERLRTIAIYAKKLGMKVALVVLTNESFCNSPKEMRGEWIVQNGYKSEPMGHYHVEICPNKPGGIETIKEMRKSVIERFCDIEPDYYYVNAYDQGGCTCEKCAPWGTCGNIKAMAALVPLIKEYSPKAEIIFSTWGFDSFIDGEWDGLFGVFENMDKRLRSMISYIMVQSKIHERIKAGEKTPGGVPLIGFPEVSMMGSVPWGGFGYNGYPDAVQANFDVFADFHKGHFQYSEGIFADANQIVNLCIYGGLYPDAKNALRAYLSHEISEEYADELLSLALILNETLLRYRLDPDGIDRTYPPPYNAPHIGEAVGDDVKFVIVKPDRVVFAAELAERLNEKIAKTKGNNWRWNIMYLRAKIDLELMENGWLISERCAGYFDTLRELYHAENSYYCVAPPIKQGHSRATVFR